MTTKDQFQEEEYQFPHDGFADEIQAEPSSLIEDAQVKPFIEQEETPPSGLAGIWANHKRMIIIIGALIAVGVTFAIIRVIHSPAPALPAAPAPAVEPAAPVVQTMVDPQVIDQLAGLKQDSINNNEAVRQLQSQVQQLTNTINQTRAAQQQLNQSLVVLVNQMQQLTGEVKILAQPKPVKAAAPAPKPAPVITFQLRAVVPGRAWIVSSEGQSQSVTIGDQVPQYGNVQSIDADAGVVITTSGKTIKF